MQTASLLTMLATELADLSSAAYIVYRATADAYTPVSPPNQAQ